MDRRRLRLGVALLVGAALLTNPVWLLPNADATHHMYRAAPAQPADVRADDRVLVCDGEREPKPCGLERRALSDGVAVGQDPSAFENRPPFVYLGEVDRYYRTLVRWEGSARVATAEPIAADAVADRLAVDGSDALDSRAAARVVSGALEGGVVRSRTRVVLDADAPDGPLLVDQDDGVYAVRRTGTNSPTVPFDDDRSEWALRGTLVGVGVALLGAARSRWRSHARPPRTR